MIRKIDDIDGDDYLSLRTGEQNLVEPGMLDICCVYDLVTIDRTKARELAAILTHFADTGELPGEESDGGKV